VSTVRLDKWLWAARFFNTRTLATGGIEGGKVHLQGGRVKPSHAVRVGDRVEIRSGANVVEVVVLVLSEQRGSAPTAHALYQETEASIARRETSADQGRGLPRAPRHGGKPGKRERRTIIRFGEFGDPHS
jgi:ribosome-associated heat shock protein Hsp15